MLLRRLPACLAYAVLVAPVTAQIRIVNWNTLDGPTPGVHDNSADMQVIFPALASQSVNGIARRPDLLILQEQTNTSAAAMAALLNGLFPGSSYIAITPAGQPGSSDPTFIDRQSFVYDSTTLSLLGSGTSIATGEHRPVIRAQFRPVGYTSPAAAFYVYGAHLMSSDPTARANQTAAMRANSDALGDVHVIYAGDFNMQSNAETGWQNLFTGSGAGLAVDPLNPTNAPQTWNNNSAFASIHTQSTRVGATPDNDGGATGGMDDRFDVQLFTHEFNDGEGLSYIPGSCRAFGNDGQRFNRAINSTPTISLGAAVANALWDASDHLPVVSDYQLPARMTVTLSSAPPPRVIVGASAIGTFSVLNSASVSTSNGADELDYSVSYAGAASGGSGGTAFAASPAAAHAVSVNTTVPGVSVGTVQFSTTSQGAAVTGSSSFGLSTTVLARANPSLSAGTTTSSQTIDFGIRARGESISGMIAVFNRAHPSGFSAFLDIDQVSGTGDSSVLALHLTEGGSLSPGSSRAGSVSFASAAVGSFSATWSIFTSDENIPGASSFAPLTLELRGRIALGGDATLDNTVDLTDFAVLAGNFNTSGHSWQQGDFDHDSLVGIGDFSILASNFNVSAAARSFAVVPEPSLVGAAVSVAGLAAMRHRGRRDGCAAVRSR
ncbi:MAG: hypothetical protein NZ561_09470 [Phycisphaerae bacterium]|nr:hypothetical protein [Phycisphaerae bacterium]MDW8261239.1 hypothetical protein [Phycisphaerales bacterium]